MKSQSPLVRTAHFLMPTLVSVFGVQPLRIGGTETFARELSLQLDRKGWKSVLCFETEPPADVAEFDSS